MVRLGIWADNIIFRNEIQNVFLSVEETDRNVDHVVVYFEMKFNLTKTRARFIYLFFMLSRHPASHASPKQNKTKTFTCPGLV